LTERDHLIVARIGAGFGWSVLFLVCAPLIPPAVVARALWRRRRGIQQRSRLAFMSTSGRYVFSAIAFVGSELVALDIFESTYFNAVDEHAATPLGAAVIALLGLVLLGDAAARASVAAGRAIAGRS
jgi:hypothetical protein